MTGRAGDADFPLRQADPVFWGEMSSQKLSRRVWLVCGSFPETEVFLMSAGGHRF